MGISVARHRDTPGANATEVAESVATPIELQLSGVEKMDYMNSTSSNNGSCSINVIFEAGSSPNTDQQNTYMRYSQATSQLPSTVSQMGITIKQSSGLPLMIYALDSPEGFFEPISLTGYAFLNLKSLTSRPFAYFFSAVLFAIYHLGMVSGNGNPLIWGGALILLTASGLILNALNERSGSILTSWLLHMCANLGINAVGFYVFGMI